MKPYTKALLLLHLCVFIWGFTAILGKYISYGALPLVYHRMLIAALFYLFFPQFWKGLKGLSTKTIAQMAFIGLIVCGHWLSFYGSIKIGNNVSVTLAALGTASLFSAFINPLITRTQIAKHEVFLGIFIIIGVSLVGYAMFKTQVQTHMPSIPMLALWVGILSAALAATFTALNKQLTNQVSALTLSGIEMASGAIGMAIFLLIFSNTGGRSLFFLEVKNNQDLWALLSLALVCTNFTFWLGTVALKELSAFTANLTVNLEPIYGMLLGAAIFKEYQALNIYFYIGATLILASVIAKPVLNLYRAKRKQLVARKTQPLH